MLRVCVVGQSVAGLASAAVLSQNALVKTITIIDPVGRREEDGFSTGLWTPALSVLPYLGEDLVPRSGCVEVSGFRSKHGVELCKPRTTLKRNNWPSDSPSLHFVQNDRLLGALQRAAVRGAAVKGVKLSTVSESAVKVRCSATGGGPVTVVCHSGREHECDLLLVADGMLSPLREQICALPPERFLRHRGYRVYYGHTGKVKVSVPSFQSWGDGKRFACVPNGAGGNQWFATIPSTSTTTTKKIEPVSSGPLSSNSRAVSAQEMHMLRHDDFAGWHSEVGALLSASAAARCCEAIAFSAVPDSTRSILFLRPEVQFMGDAGFTLDPILAQGAGLAIEEALLYSNALSRATPSADTKTLLFEAASAYAHLADNRRRRLFWLSNASQLVGTMRKGAAARDLLLRATPAALKGRIFDILIGVSNGNSLMGKK